MSAMCTWSSETAPSNQPPDTRCNFNKWRSYVWVWKRERRGVVCGWGGDKECRWGEVEGECGGVRRSVYWARSSLPHLQKQSSLRRGVCGSKIQVEEGCVCVLWEVRGTIPSIRAQSHPNVYSLPFTTSCVCTVDTICRGPDWLPPQGSPYKIW